jgi:hypothetical protein
MGSFIIDTSDLYIDHTFGKVEFVSRSHFVECFISDERILEDFISHIPVSKHIEYLELLKHFEQEIRFKVAGSNYITIKKGEVVEMKTSKIISLLLKSGADKLSEYLTEDD